MELYRDDCRFMRVLRDCFPDPERAPALAYVPSTATMYPGLLVEIDPPRCYGLANRYPNGLVVIIFIGL